MLSFPSGSRVRKTDVAFNHRPGVCGQEWQSKLKGWSRRPRAFGIEAEGLETVEYMNSQGLLRKNGGGF